METSFFTNLKLKVQDNYTVRIIEKPGGGRGEEEGIGKHIHTSPNILTQRKSKDQKKSKYSSAKQPVFVLNFETFNLPLSTSPSFWKNLSSGLLTILRPPSTAILDEIRRLTRFCKPPQLQHESDFPLSKYSNETHVLCSWLPPYLDEIADSQKERG